MRLRPGRVQPEERAQRHAGDEEKQRALDVMCHVAVWPSVNDRLALLLVTWKKSKVGRLAKHVVEFTGQGVAFVAGNGKL